MVSAKVIIIGTKDAHEDTYIYIYDTRVLLNLLNTINDNSP